MTHETVVFVVDTGAGVTVLVIGALAGAAVRYLRRLNRTIEVVAKEFGNNGGSTMRDAIDRLEEGQKETRAWQRRHLSVHAEQGNQ